MKAVSEMSSVARMGRRVLCRSQSSSIRLDIVRGVCSSSRPPIPVKKRWTHARHSDTFGSRPLSTKSTLPSKGTPSFAFAFDIDGVLLHSSDPIPGATETLRFLHEHSIPFLLLTNGGGRLEKDRVADLSAKLGLPLTTSNFVQSHTPFTELVDSLRDKTILVTGQDSDKCRKIAEAYGFRRVITPSDILAAEPRVWPFTALEDVHTNSSRPLPDSALEDSRPASAKESLVKVDAMFVFNDPRDWALDTQIITDLLLSEQGYLGTYSSKNGDTSLDNCGWQGDGQPSLYFSNGDLFWSTGYHLPRFGQGAFQAAVAGVWRRVTGGHELQRTVFGKPSRETYAFAERVLQKHRHELLKGAGSHGGGRLERVYMVGDNPESDIAGANDYKSEHGTSWESILVKTGVWTADRGGELKGVFKPNVVVADVKEAVRAALEREGWKGML